ncbi:NADPH-dependent oxidoreductase 2-alkenal reductase (AtAER) (NADP-dependent alkenal double bond reductase P1) (DBR1) (NADPH-azodicarbonyl/quinone reductase) (NADPH:2-alkenal/one alpha, partial [Durusdinium trenchii]
GSAYWAFMNWTPGSVPVWRICGVVLESKAAEWVGEQRRSALQIRPAAEGFAKGELCMAMAPWRELNAVNAEQLKKAAFSCLELVAQTGYCGAKFVARPKPGDVAYVSGAAGATGLIACQTFKQLGCRVIGSCGSKDKVEMLKSLGFEAFNYKEESVLAALKRLCPDGLNVCFDNVGGETLEAMLEMLNDGGTVAVCGAISEYDTRWEKRKGVRNLFQAVAKRLRIEGFLDGTIKECATFVDGFENLPDGILGLFKGTNTGKMLVRAPLTSLGGYAK